MFRFLFFIFLAIIFSFAFAAAQEEGRLLPQKVTLHLALTVPSANYQITLRSIYWNKKIEKLFVLLLLYEDGVGVQIPVERTVDDVVLVPHPGAKEVVYFVLDCKGVLPDSIQYDRIASYSEFKECIRGARCLRMPENVQLYRDDHLDVTVSQSEEGDLFVFLVRDPDITGYLKKKNIFVSLHPKDAMDSIIHMHESVLGSNDLYLNLLIKAQGDNYTGVFLLTHSGRIVHARQVKLVGPHFELLKALVVGLREWAANERAHFFRACFCRPELKASLVEEFKLLNALSLSEFFLGE